MNKVLYMLVAALICASCHNANHYCLTGHIVDPVNDTIYDGRVEVRDGAIVAITPARVRPSAPYIMPGFYDAHMHIESTLMLPEHFAALAVAQGTVGAINDPHEIANVLDVAGIHYMLASARKVRFHFHTSAPSCVPSTPFETAGGDVTPEEMNELLAMDEIYGCGEVMNVPGVLFHDSVLMTKIRYTLDAGKIVDGHAPAISEEDAQAYFSAGVSTNHECTSLKEGRFQHDLGVLVAIREGSAACDFEALSPLLADYGEGLAFCTDDIYPDELEQGHINRLCARAVAKGYPLWHILHAACVAPVRHYHLTHGLLQVGDPADFICVADLKDFHVLSTYIGGHCVYTDGKVTKDFVVDATPTVAPYPNHFVAAPLSEEDIRVVPQAGRQLKVIDSEEGMLLTGVMLVEPKVENNNVVSNPEQDILKVVCYSRHSQAKPVVAFLEGFGLEQGAMASTIAHDCHNIIAVGTNDADIVKAINRLVETQGGLAACCGDTIVDMPLPIAGLMSPMNGHEVAMQYTAIRDYVTNTLGCDYKAPFMTLAFMALPVIPQLKITDLGLFDGVRFAFTDSWE